jgi:hypothetical protein
MSSEKWFDWDTSEDSKKSEGAVASDAAVSPPVEEAALFDSAEVHQSVVQESAVQESEDTPIGSSEPEVRAEPEGLDTFGSLTSLAAAAEQPPSLEGTSSSLQSFHTVPLAAKPVDALRPFHLRIIGKLPPLEKERFVELLTRENFGIREVDLEIQLEAGQILLPQISEYAAVLVAQTLKGAPVELRLSPSDLETAAPSDALSNLSTASSTPLSAPSSHAAESIPITPNDTLSGSGESEKLALEPLDVLIATGLIREPEWKAESSDAFGEIVEALKRELRFKAYLKKADALVRFEAKVISSPWISDKECRVQVSAVAVRFRR